jgi:hypothetical protein
MTARQGWLKLLAAGALAVAAGPGPAAAQEPAGHTDTPLGHVLQADRPGHAALCAALPAGCRDHLYVFFVNGMDPLGAANLRGLAGYVQSQGFPHAWYGQMFQGGVLARRVREVRRQDPQAHFALVGFSAGTYVVRDAAQDLAQEGVRVDLLCYLGGDYLSNSASSRPANVGKVVNVTAHGFLLSGGDLLFNGTDIDGAVNVRVPCRHMLLPSRRETIDVLLRELIAVASSCRPAEPTPAPAAAPGAAPRLVPVPDGGGR